MLKIKDEIELKELEKLGYLDMGNCYQRYDNWGVQIFIDKQTREITRVHPYSIKIIPSFDEIQELFGNGLVEKVEE
jgi:hypothetical protein